MLRSIADNGKKKDPLDKKSAENGINKTKDIVNKRPPENHNKKDTPDKSVGNLDKVTSDTTEKINRLLLPHHEKMYHHFC
jgi:hypothetical protein